MELGGDRTGHYFGRPDGPFWHPLFWRARGRLGPKMEDGGWIMDPARGDARPTVTKGMLVAGVGGNIQHPNRTKPHQTAPKNEIFKVSRLPGEGGKLHPGNPEISAKAERRTMQRPAGGRNSPVGRVAVVPQARHYHFRGNSRPSGGHRSPLQRNKLHRWERRVMQPRCGR